MKAKTRYSPIFLGMKSLRIWGSAVNGLGQSRDFLSNFGINSNFLKSSMLPFFGSGLPGPLRPGGPVRFILNDTAAACGLGYAFSRCRKEGKRLK